MRRRLSSATFPLHRHSLQQLAMDGIMVALAYELAYRLRFDAGIPHRYQLLLNRTIAWAVVASLLIFVLFRLYQKWFRYVTGPDYVAIVQAIVVATLSLPAFVATTHPVKVRSTSGFTTVNIPLGVLVLFFLLTLTMVVGLRFAARLLHDPRARGFRPRKDARRILIVGAGDGGRLVLREIVRNPTLGLNPVGFVDDDARLRSQRVDGVRVLGGTDDLPKILDEAEPDEVTIAIPSAPGTLRARVVKACRARGIPVRTLPTVFELLQTGGNFVRQVRDVQVEDVLGREPVRMELDRVGAYLNGEVVMVTGAGGSIGAELCRQIARVAPRRLILLDHAEDNLFEVVRELEEDRHVRTAVPVLDDFNEEACL